MGLEDITSDTTSQKLNAWDANMVRLSTSQVLRQYLGIKEVVRLGSRLPGDYMLRLVEGGFLVGQSQIRNYIMGAIADQVEALACTEEHGNLVRLRIHGDADVCAPEHTSESADRLTAYISATEAALEARKTLATIRLSGMQDMSSCLVDGEPGQSAEPAGVGGAHGDE